MGSTTFQVGPPTSLTSLKGASTRHNKQTFTHLGRQLNGHDLGTIDGSGMGTIRGWRDDEEGIEAVSVFSKVSVSRSRWIYWKIISPKTGRTQVVSTLSY